MPRSPSRDDDWGDTEPMNSRAEHPLRAPAETWHSDPVESWHSLLAHRPKLAAQHPKPEPQRPPVDPPQAWRSILDNPLGGRRRHPRSRLASRTTVFTLTMSSGSSRWAGPIPLARSMVSARVRPATSCPMMNRMCRG